MYSVSRSDNKMTTISQYITTYKNLFGTLLVATNKSTQTNLKMTQYHCVQFVFVA